MKKTVLAILVVLGGILNASAQKVAVIDMNYILKSIPQYEAANDQLSQLFGVRLPIRHGDSQVDHGG